MLGWKQFWDIGFSGIQQGLRDYRRQTNNHLDFQKQQDSYRLSAMPEFYDTHAHLDYPDFAEELPQLIQRAGEAGITKLVSIATNLESSRKILVFAESYPNVFAAVGCHPTEVLEAPDDVRPALRELGRHPKVVALGETGLDYHRLRGNKNGTITAEDLRYKERQADVYRQHLEVATDLGLNCVIHQRDSFEHTLGILEPFAGKVRGVFHCFANDAKDMRRVLALGSLVSFTGILTFKNGANIRETMAATPIDQFMLETDSPFLAPVPYRGKRCEPAYVREIAAVAAQVKQCSLEELSTATCETARRFFQKL
jgi:TatD DNase family protein